MVIQLSSPFHEYLKDLFAKLKDLDDGEVASYLPELVKSAPDAFAISIATIDGEIYSVGDSDTEFSIQSISAPFAYGGALASHGRDTVLDIVGTTPTGNSSNSIGLDQSNNRPLNPMTNAGAIAITSLTKGENPHDQFANLQSLFSGFAGRELKINDEFYNSERRHGEQFQDVASLMYGSGVIKSDPESVLDLFFKQCALSITTDDLAMMGATLANNGVNPGTGGNILEAENVRDVLALMMTCGMHDLTSQWIFDVGLPTKCGKSGGLLAILPGQLSVAIWSPRLDKAGNSVRSVAACRQISRDFGLHLLMNASSVEQVVRRQARGIQQQSMRIRNPNDRNILIKEGDRIALIEIQGGLNFASAERMLRRLGTILPTCEFLIIDFRRLQSIDEAAHRLVDDFLKSNNNLGVEIAFAQLDETSGQTHDSLSKLARSNSIRTFNTVDDALEAFEDKILQDQREPEDFTRFALDRLELFIGLNRDEISLVQERIRSMQFDPGQTILKSGDKGHMLYVVAYGSVSVMISGKAGSPQTRVGSLGPGQFFGEMAVLGDGRRSADVIADDRVVCYGLTAYQLDALRLEQPQILSKILGNIAREFSRRLRRANLAISSLQ